ncbi:MAG: hypothetical protein HYX75_03505 [Acidobacteria bacterium]|nr:hypothetical protein [Acidobacteriota bacterium]
MKLLQIVVRKLGAVLTGLGVLVLGLSTAEGAAGRADLAAQAYQSRLGHAFEYRLSADGSRVTRASGVLSDPTQGDRVDAARRFFSENGEMFGVDPDDVARAGSRILTSRNAVHVALTQTIDGIRVMGPSSYVHYDGSGRVVLLQNNFVPGKHPETEPKVNIEEATSRAVRMCSENGGTVTTSSPELVLHREGEELRLVYRVPAQVASTQPKYWLVLVDALNPNVVPLRLNMVLEATAKGTIYPENPAASSLTSVTFKNLKSPTSLSGAHVRTYNGNYQLSTPYSKEDVSKFTTASDSNGDYTFPVNDSAWGDHRFGEAMAYYHIDRAYGILASMGFKELRSQMPVFVNCADGADNAFYARAIFDSGFIATWVPLMLNPFAFDSDIFTHEYGHAVLDSIQPALIERSNDVYGAAYHEGWGDCVAAGLTGNPLGAEYAAIDRKVGVWMGRSADNSNRYPGNVVHPMAGFSEPHYAGMIVSGAFWNLYKAIGTRALQTFLDANYLLDGTENFFGIRDAAVQAAEERDKDAVKRAFAAHGISGPDRGNPAKVEILDVYASGSANSREEMKRSTFRRGEAIMVAIDARIQGTAPGYYFYGNLTITPNSEEIITSPEFYPPSIEAVNGVRSHLKSFPYLVYFIGLNQRAPLGTYELKFEGHLEGTKLAFTRSWKITIVE